MHFEAVIVLRSNLLIVLELYIVTSCIVYLANTINTASISQTYVASHVRRIHSGAGFANAHLFLVCSFRVMATQNVKVWLFIVYYTKHFDQHYLHQQSHTIKSLLHAISHRVVHIVLSPQATLVQPREFIVSECQGEWLSPWMVMGLIRAGLYQSLRLRNLGYKSPLKWTQDWTQV